MDISEYLPTAQQIQNGMDKLNQGGIVFESNSTFPHNRADQYIKALKLAGYKSNLIGIGVEVRGMGYMYSIYDSNEIDSHKRAQELTIKHFSM